MHPQQSSPLPQQVNGNRAWMEYFRLITPVGLFILGIISSLIIGKLNSIDDKLFAHLTNDEIHTPKSMAVTKAEFTMYQAMRDKQMSDIKEGQHEIKKILERNLRAR